MVLGFRAVQLDGERKNLHRLGCVSGVQRDGAQQVHGLMIIGFGLQDLADQNFSLPLTAGIQMRGGLTQGLLRRSVRFVRSHAMRLLSHCSIARSLSASRYIRQSPDCFQSAGNPMQIPAALEHNVG